MAIKQFTQDEINKISWVYKKKYWWNQDLFKADIEKQYWTWAFDTVKWALKGWYETFKTTPKQSAASQIAQKNLWVTTEQANTIANNAYWTTPVTPTVPKIETPAYVAWTEPATDSWITSSVDTTKINSSADASTAVVSAIKENITDVTQENIDKTNALNTRTEEDLKITEDRKKQEEDLQKFKDELTKKYETDVKSEMDSYKKSLADSYWKEIALEKTNLEAQQKANTAAIDLQKFKDEEAIKERTKELEVNRMRSAWALNRLWLAGSAYAVNSWIRLAEEGATAIAWLKINASYNEASAKAKITEQEVNYAKVINSAIDTYTEKNYNLEQDYIKLSAQTQNSLLLSEKEKTQNINKLTDTYLINKRANEDAIFNNMKAARTEILNSTKALEEQFKSEENTYKEKVNSLFTSGQWQSLSNQQKINYANKTWLSISELEGTQRKLIYSTAVKNLASVLWNDFIPSEAQTSQIISEVNRLTLAWKPLEEAINIATNRLIKSTPEYSAILEGKKTKASWSSTSKIKTSDMKQDADWNWYAWTWAEWVSTWLAWKTSGWTPPTIEQDAEWNLLTIDKDTGKASPVYTVSEKITPWVYPYSPYANSYNTMSTKEEIKTPVKWKDNSDPYWRPFQKL